jgi:hypothetical protein
MTFFSFILVKFMTLLTNKTPSSLWQPSNHKSEVILTIFMLPSDFVLLSLLYKLDYKRCLCYYCNCYSNLNKVANKNELCKNVKNNGIGHKVLIYGFKAHYVPPGLTFENFTYFMYFIWLSENSYYLSVQC